MITVVMRLSGGATPTTGQILGTLPERYRPATEMLCATHNLRGIFFVMPNGTIGIEANSISDLPLNNYMGATLVYPYND